MPKPLSVDDYLAAQPDETRAALRKVRAVIRKTLPGAEETIGYGIPCYRRGGTYVVYFAGWKRHYSLYPVGDRAVAAFGETLAPYEMSKGTIRFPLSEPVPLGLIQRLVRLAGPGGRCPEADEGGSNEDEGPEEEVRRVRGQVV